MLDPDITHELMQNYGPNFIPNGDELCLQYYNYGFREFLDFGLLFIVA